MICIKVHKLPHWKFIYIEWEINNLINLHIRKSILIRCEELFSFYNTEKKYQVQQSCSDNKIHHILNWLTAHLPMRCDDLSITVCCWQQSLLNIIFRQISFCESALKKNILIVIIVIKKLKLHYLFLYQYCFLFGNF